MIGMQSNKFHLQYDFFLLIQMRFTVGPIEDHDTNHKISSVICVASEIAAPQIRPTHLFGLEMSA